VTALPEPRPIHEYQAVDRAQFLDQIRPAGQPAVLRGFAADWPAVVAARSSDEDLVAYLRGFRAARPVKAIVGPPEIEGRFFYTDDVRALNFSSGRATLDPFLDRLLRDRDDARPYAMAIQSEEIPTLLPGFERENSVDLLGEDVVPRVWIGNKLRVATHFDLMENIGVVVAGRRRFTLLPPEQLPNLYVGPFELTPAGTPVSMVDFEHPDLERFPRFAEAMAHAQRTILDPGDVIYIPFHWWHAVDSLDPFNLFVNYWWNDGPREAGGPYDAMVYALFSIKPLPREQRLVWRMVFDHFVFGVDGDPAEHLPLHARGMMGPPTPELLARMRTTLKQILAKL
jgi:hypothetical protein